MARQVVWIPQTRLNMGAGKTWSQAARDALEVSDKKLIRITVISTDLGTALVFNALTSNDPYAPTAAWTAVALSMTPVSGLFTGSLVLTRESFVGTTTTGIVINGALQRYLRRQFYAASGSEFDVSVLIEFLDAD